MVLLSHRLAASSSIARNILALRPDIGVARLPHLLTPKTPASFFVMSETLLSITLKGRQKENSHRRGMFDSDVRCGDKWPQTIERLDWKNFRLVSVMSIFSK